MSILHRFWHWLTTPCGYCRMPLYLGPRYHLDDGSYCCPEHYNLGLLARFSVQYEVLEMRRAQTKKE